MKKILICVAALAVIGLVVVVVVLGLSIDSIIKKGVETVGPQITKTEMKLDGVSLSIFSGSGKLRGFLLGNPQGYQTPSAIKVGEVAIGVKPRSVLSDKVHVTHVRMKGPEITFEGTLGIQNNLSKILENVDSVAGGSAQKPADHPPAPAGASKKIQVDDFLISGAQVHVSMNMLGGKSLTVPLPEIHLTNLGTGPDGITAAELTKLVLNEVTTATLQAVKQAVGDLSKVATDTLKGASKTATNTLNKVVGDLFQKK